MYNVTVISTSKCITEVFEHNEEWERFGFNITILTDINNTEFDEIPDVVVVPVSTSRESISDYTNYVINSDKKCRIIMYGRRSYERIKEAMDKFAFGYIPIPTQKSDIDTLVIRLKRSFDRNCENSYAVLKEYEQNENYIYNLLYGKYHTDKELSVIMRHLNPQFSFARTEFSLIGVELIDINDYISKKWRHDKDLFYTAIGNILKKTDDLFNVYNVNITENKIYAIVFYEITSNIDNYISETTKNINDIMQFTVSSSILLSGNVSAIVNLGVYEQIIKLAELTSDYQTGNSPDNEKGAIRNAKKYLKNNIKRDISLNDVAKSVGLSSAYFSRLFKQETGENFIDFLINARMEKAKEYLSNSDYKTYEISELVGYSKSKYFSKIFKNYTGYTPTEYKSIINNN